MGDKDKSDMETVKLNSADGHQFIVHRKAAMISGTIKSMLSENGMVSVVYCERGERERV
jgi:C1A family cysteine protease